MNKEKLLSLMPTVIITDDVNKKVEEQRGIIENGKSFLSHLSINRFLHKKLTDLDIDEAINLFSDLSYENFVINENSLYFSGVDIDSFAVILEEKFNLKDMYELDNFYIENLLNGRDITAEDVNIDGENLSFSDVLVQFVFSSSRMSMGDTPTMVLMLTVKKALLGSYLAEKNVESLLNGKKEIYDITILMQKAKSS